MDTFDKLSKVLKPIQIDPLWEVRSSMLASMGVFAGTTDALTSFRKQLEATPFKGVQSMLASMGAHVGTADAFKLARQQFKLPDFQHSFMQPYLPQLEKFHQLTGALKPMFEELEKMRELYDEVQVNYVKEISMNAGGSVTSAPTFPTAEEIKDIVENAIKDSGIGQKVARLEESIGKLTKFINNQKSGIVAVILIGLLVNFISTHLLDPAIEAYKTYISQNKTQLTRAIKKIEISHSEMKAAFVKNYRFVSTDVLNVRQTDSAKSPIVGKLYFGQTVQIIRQQRNWTLVEWKSEDEEIVTRGWVFTRYLTKFR